MNYFKYSANSNGYIFLHRWYDKKVFGTYRAVEELRKISIKNVRINNGEVQVKFQGKWRNVEEANESGHTYVRNLTRDLAAEKGTQYYNLAASVCIV